MFLLAATLASAGLTPLPIDPPEAPVCALARTAIADYVAMTKLTAPDVALDTTSPSAAIFAQCPQILAALPAPFRAATGDEMARVRDAFTRNPATVYTVTAPEIAPDGQSATISIGYYCSGLCGFGYRLHYVRKGDAWVPAPGATNEIWQS